MGCLDLLALGILITGQDVLGVLSALYQPERVCAFVGSTVDMSCIYNNSSGLTTKQPYWTKDPSDTDPSDLRKDTNYKDRVTVDCQLLGKTTCRLRIKSVTELDATRYYCVLTQTEGPTWTEESGVSLEVREAPARPTVSISPHGDIQEGTAVTLTCESSSDLAVLSYHWFRREPYQYLGTGHKWTINRTTPENSGRYSCKSTYECGPIYSDAHLRVVYPPKNTTLFPERPLVVVEGNSMSMTCSSDANPAVARYTWFKVGASTAKGSGQQYNITNIRSEDGGHYYCEARNKYGAQNSSAVLISVRGDKSSVLTAVVAVLICGIVSLVCVLLLVRIPRKRNQNQKHKEPRSNASIQVEGGTEGDALYCNVSYQRSGPGRDAEIAEGGGEEEDDAPYSTLMERHGSSPTAGGAGDHVQYASVQFRQFRASQGCPDQPEGEPSPTYSSVK